MSNATVRTSPANSHVAADTLRSWQHTTFDQVLRLFVMMAVPAIIADVILSFHAHRDIWAIYSIIAFVILTTLAFTRGHYQLRTTLIISLFATYMVATLLYVGLVGAGRLHTLFLVFLTTLLLPPRRAIAVSTCIALVVIVILGGMAGGLIPMSPNVSARAVEPQTIIVNLLTLLIFIGSTTWLMLSLIARLSHGLNEAESALAERNTLNSRLEDLVAERTADLTHQLALQRALAGCSRVLLSRGTTSEAYQTAISEALAIILEAVGGDYIEVTQYMGNEYSPENVLRSYRILAKARRPGVPAKRWMSREECVDMPLALNVWQAGGGSFNGPLVGRFPEHPTYHRYLDDNHIQSSFIQSLHVDGQIWGHILIIDYTEMRSWDDATVQAIQTVADMIVTFTEGWDAARALQKRESQLRIVGDNMPNGFIYQYYCDPDLRPSFIYLSSGVEQLWGVTSAEGLADASAIYQTILAEDQNRLRTAHLVSMQQMSVFAEEVCHLLPDGEVSYAYLCSRPRYEPDGSIIWDGVAIDITERQQVEAALVHAKDAAEVADAAKTAFLANMSHEIRTPLNTVIGVTDLLLNTDLSSLQRDYVATINTAGQSLLSLISDVLDLSRIEARHMEIDMQPFDLSDCLNAARDLMAHAAHAKGLHLTYQIDTGIPAGIIGDAARLRQVVINLLSNAVKFTSSGTIDLTAHASPLDADRHLVEIAVRDTGIGISQGHQHQIFAPFTQADRSTARRYGGSGLGLAICRQLVDLMGGQIHLESTLGIGSIFTVTIPFTSAPPPVDTTIKRRDHVMLPLDSLRILVVEDNPINQKVTSELITFLGHMVTVVASGQAAIDAVTGATFDVVIMDIQMPEMDGEEATQRIRSQGTTIHQPSIIALTANVMPGDRERCLRAGMNDYLSKPVRSVDIQRALSHVASPLIMWDTLNVFLHSFGPDRAESLKEVVQLFEQDIRAQLNKLETVIASADPMQVRKEAHRLRGGYLQIGACGLAEQCHRIEQIDATADLPRLAHDLWDCYERTLVALCR